MMLCLLLVFVSLGCDDGGQSESLIIATATPGGTYYPVGVGIGTLLTEKLQPDIHASAINSAGSGENIQMMINNETKLAILQGLFGAMAYSGTGRYDTPVTDIRSITMLWQNVEHFLIRSSAVKTGTVADLKSLGERFSIGKRGSGTEGSTRTILEALSISPDTDIQPEFLGYAPSVQAMMDGRISGATVPAGPPVAAATSPASPGATGAAGRSQDRVDLARDHQLDPEARDGDHGDARVLELLVRARVRLTLGLA